MIFSRKNKKEKLTEEKSCEIFDKKEMILTSSNLKSLFSNNEDILFREIKINSSKITIIYIDGLININTTSDYILKPLTQNNSILNVKSEKELIKLIQEGAIYFINQKIRDNINDVISDILNGSTALIFDDEKKGITFDNKGFEKRSITEPTSENVVKGSKDSFVETLRVNTATIRRKIKSHNLKIENTIIGKRTHTSVDIIYIEGITNKDIIKKVMKRLNDIDVDGILTTGYIEEFITDSNFSVFPQTIYTERPDKFCSDIIEGRVGLLVDGLPIGFIIPATLLQCLQAPEDYSQNYIISSIIRFMRFSLMLLTLVLPAFYVAVTTFHQEMIPYNLATFFEASKQSVPLPSSIEVIIMLASFEVLVEASLRLPKTIGSAISIVGAIVVGDAAVNAKFISPAVVVIISFTAIASFTMPNQDFSNAIRLWRLIFVISASILGIIGLTFGGLLLLLLLSNKEVFGVPYLAPFVASEMNDLDDSIFRFRIPSMKKRPYNLKTENKIRR